MAFPPKRRGPGPIPTRLDSIVRTAMSNLAIDRPLDDYRVWQAWDEVVGDAIARNAEPLRLDGTRLVVTVRNSTWMHELSLLRHDLVRRLNGWMGRELISEIYLTVGRLDAKRDRGRADPAVGRPMKDAPDDRPTTPVPELVPDSAGRDVREAFERLWRSARDRDLKKR